jgi:hypothetical protein
MLAKSHRFNRFEVARLLMRYGNMCTSLTTGLAQKYIEQDRADDFSL